MQKFLLLFLSFTFLSSTDSYAAAAEDISAPYSAPICDMGNGIRTAMLPAKLEACFGKDGHPTRTVGATLNPLLNEKNEIYHFMTAAHAFHSVGGDKLVEAFAIWGESPLGKFPLDINTLRMPSTSGRTYVDVASIGPIRPFPLKDAIAAKGK